MLIITVTRRHKRRFLTSKNQNRVAYTTMTTTSRSALEVKEPPKPMKSKVDLDVFDEDEFAEEVNDEDSRENEFSPGDLEYFENEIEQFDRDEVDDDDEFDDYCYENGDEDDNDSYEYYGQQTGSTRNAYGLGIKFVQSKYGSIRRPNPNNTATTTATSLNSLTSLFGTDTSSEAIFTPNFSLTSELLGSDDDEDSLESRTPERKLKRSNRRGNTNRFLPTNEIGDSGGPFVCDLCGKRYLHHRSLNDHKKYHMGATRCPLCNKTFSKVANMRAHFTAQHMTGRSSNDNFAIDKSDEDQQVGQTNHEMYEFGA